MPRRRFRYDATLGEMVEVGLPDLTEQGSAAILPEIEPFISPRDGTVIRTRSELRDYMGRNNLVPYEEAKTQKAEGDRYQAERTDSQLKERLWEGVSKTFSMGNKPRK